MPRADDQEVWRNSQGCSWPFLIKRTPLCNVFSNAFPQILKPKSTRSRHLRSLLTPLTCANVRRGAAPSALSESIPHLVADPPAPCLPLLPPAHFGRDSFVLARGSSCTGGAFPHGSHHPQLLLQLPLAKQFLYCVSPLYPVSSPRFSRSIARVTGHLAAWQLSDASPLTAGTSSPISAQPRQHAGNAGNMPTVSRWG